jgi:5-methylcytosine-specific restriction endonuclease McrA
MKQLSLFGEIPPVEVNKHKKKRSSMLDPESKPVGYGEYIQSNEWLKKAKVAKDMAGNKCQKCGSPGPLHVHHLNYDNLYREHFYDVKVLCVRCHKEADQYRENEKRYDSYLHTKYGDNAADYDTEVEYAEYEAWLEKIMG